MSRIYRIDNFGRVQQFTHILNSKVELMLGLLGLAPKYDICRGFIQIMVPYRRYRTYLNLIG